MKILVSGLINQETNINVHSFPVGYEPIVYAFNEITNSLSGVAYNIINALRALGDCVLPVSIIGKDAVANQIIEELNSLGVNTDYLYKGMDVTCTSAVLFDDTGRRKVFCDLKNIQDLVYPVSKLEDGIQESDALVICNINFNDELIKSARQYGKPVFTDVHVLKNIDDEYNSRFMANSDVLFLSDEGIEGNYEDFLIQIHRKYKNKVIVLGMGAKGAMLLDSNDKKVYFVESVHVRPVVNTVGAGDSLFSAFVHSYLQDKDSLKALKLAVTFASYKIGESGGAKGFADSEKIKEICNRTEYNVRIIKCFD